VRWRAGDAGRERKKGGEREREREISVRSNRKREFVVVARRPPRRSIFSTSGRSALLRASRRHRSSSYMHSFVTMILSCGDPARRAGGQSDERESTTPLVRCCRSTVVSPRCISAVKDALLRASNLSRQEPPSFTHAFTRFSLVATAAAAAAVAARIIKVQACPQTRIIPYIYMYLFFSFSFAHTLAHSRVLSFRSQGTTLRLRLPYSVLFRYEEVEGKRDNYHTITGKRTSFLEYIAGVLRQNEHLSAHRQHTRGGTPFARCTTWRRAHLPILCARAPTLLCAFHSSCLLVISHTYHVPRTRALARLHTCVMRGSRVRTHMQALSEGTRGSRTCS